MEFKLFSGELALDESAISNCVQQLKVLTVAWGRLTYLYMIDREG